jgi:hypothetical protein
MAEGASRAEYFHLALAVHDAPRAKKNNGRTEPHEDELNALLDLPCGSEAAIRKQLLAIVSYLSLVQEK